MSACNKCGGKGWHPVWVEDPTCRMYGGYEDGESYCACEAGVRLKQREVGVSAEVEDER